MSQTVDIPKELIDKIRKFRLQPDASSAALVVKIDRKTLSMIEDEKYDNIEMEDLAEELPGHEPRFVVLSYEKKYSDGRRKYHFVILNWCPPGIQTGLLTLYTSALINFKNTVDIQTVIEAREGSEGLTKEFVETELK
ncbi:glia maturation factor beta [Pyrrhoderma noxium]|uniref:Glia maturation factor beta n=1 Tax=Pyrrhoderma noxium TaxID=2282107 RepID=A0A286UWK3_9AGAM|nr:glia maturation factor beta [Pyrrhoderma noxium]